MFLREQSAISTQPMIPMLIALMIGSTMKMGNTLPRCREIPLGKSQSDITDHFPIQSLDQCLCYCFNYCRICNCPRLRNKAMFISSIVVIYIELEIQKTKIEALVRSGFSHEGEMGGGGGEVLEV